MAVRAVVRYPARVLKRPAEPVGTVTDPLRKLAEDLTDTMRHAPATVGLAAPQVGESVRAFVLDVTGHRRATRSHGLVVLFNPEILDSWEPDLLREGCLSIPDLLADVRRPSKLALRGLAPDGRERRYEMEGFEARAALHEIDHLDGTLILDRVGSPSAIHPRRTYR